jgi:hypothetical protein
MKKHIGATLKINKPKKNVRLIPKNIERMKNEI